MHLVAFICLLAVTSATPIPDKVYKELVNIWPKSVSQIKQESDSAIKLHRVAGLMAKNPHFDLEIETVLHPEHLDFILMVGELRHSAKMRAIAAEPSAAYSFGGLLGILAISFGLPVWWISWTRRTERRIPAHTTFSEHYWALITRMTWRYLIVVVSILAVILLAAEGGRYTDEQMMKRGLFFWAVTFLCLGVVLLYSRTLTKRRFASQTPTTAA